MKYNKLMFSTLSIGEIFLQYLKWHYSRGYNEFIELTRRFFKFLIHFFSFKLLLSTLFSPWKRMSEHYEKGLHIEETISTLIVNLIMRGVGFVSRVAIIFVGLIVLGLYSVFSLIATLFWLFLPILIICAFFASFFLIYASV